MGIDWPAWHAADGPLLRFRLIAPQPRGRPVLLGVVGLDDATDTWTWAARPAPGAELLSGEADSMSEAMMMVEGMRREGIVPSGSNMPALWAHGLAHVLARMARQRPAGVPKSDWLLAARNALVLPLRPTLIALDELHRTRQIVQVDPDADLYLPATSKAAATAR